MNTLTNVFYLSLRLLLRHKMLPLAIAATVVVMSAAMLAAEFGGRQPATIALDVGLSTLRLVLPLFMVFQVQELFSREFERKHYLLSITYPVSRVTWLTGRFMALLFVSGMLLLLNAALLTIEVSLISQGYEQATPVSLSLPFWLTILFTGVDLLVLLALACFLAIIATTPSFVLVGTLGFMLIARSYSAILTLLHSQQGLVDNAESYRSNLGLLSYLLPDLGALDIRMVALYGRIHFLPQDWPLLVGTALLYAIGLIALAIWLFRQKQFT